MDADAKRAVRERLVEVLGLKSLDRAGWARVGVRRPESVAAHSWGVAWLVLALCPEGVDRGRALAMAVIHDLAEVRVGDLTPHDRVARTDKQARERAELEALVSVFGHADELAALWLEYDRGGGAEARFVKACDKLDMALQAGRYEAEQRVSTGEFVTSALDAIEDDWLRWLAHPAAIS